MYSLEGFSTIYVEKTGLFNSKKLNISLDFYDDNIKGRALKLSIVSGYVYQTICIEYNTICNYEKYDFENSNALKIDTSTVVNGKTWNDSYVFPFEPRHNIDDVIKKLEEKIEVYKQEQKRIIELENERKMEQLEKEEKERQHLLDIQNFYATVYKFHIHDNTPTYTISQGDTDCFTIYIGDDKSINFLLIEAKSNTEIHSVISYDEIHYYEKAGAVHFATNINAHYQGSQSFGGSFVGGKVSAGAAALGGILFGQMGMAVGAMLSYKPAEYTPPTYTPSQFDISSEITKIDERSVILNYYSEQHKQYMDIELPQDIYNFMQTYLPDKKYAIVIEKEKQNAVGNTAPAQATQSIGEDTIVQRLTKLKQLYEMELITESEYLERKKELLAEI